MIDIFVNDKDDAAYETSFTIKKKINIFYFSLFFVMYKST